MGREKIAAKAVLRIVGAYVALELAILPFRQEILHSISEYIHNMVPGTYDIVWPCTAVDEILLLTAATLATPTNIGAKIAWSVVGSLIIWAYNVARISLTLKYMSPFLHDILFRLGGFVLVLGIYWAFLESNKRYKLKKR